MRNTFKYLSQYSTTPKDVDRLIISAFLEINELKLRKNKLLKSYSINSKIKEEYSSLLEFLFQESFLGHHIKSFSFKNLFWSITSRVFASKIVGGASHREFLCLVSCSSILFSPSHCGSMCVFSLKITFINRNL